MTIDPPPVRAILLDFDGTMLETESASYGSWRELLDEHGYELTPEAWSAAVGTIGGVDPLELLEEHLGTDVDRDVLEDRAKRRHHQLLEQERLRPGIEQLVDEARDRGLHVAVVTSASERWVRGHLARLGLYDDIEVVAADGDADRAKPHPLLYREAAALLGVDAAAAVAVEDSPNGVKAARAAGMQVIAFPNPITEAMDLGEADAIVADLDGLGLDGFLDVLGRRAEAAV
ncbi:MAG TPA: HAD family phosphatase [Solirubrobacteraceae bacterium]|nr:HAD family phosphatase [Solirubrobacteraceae bacterium]